VNAAGTLTARDARRIALAAQGFGEPRPTRITKAHLSACIRRLGLVQLDFVNVICPSHYLVPFSRLGPYPRPLFDAVVYHGGQFTEQWAHEASIIPMETWPLLRDRMENHRARPWGFDEIMRLHNEYCATVLSEIRARGPLGPADLPDPTHTGRTLPGSWYGNVPRAVLEACFGRGQLAVTARRVNFSRVYDLAERVIPSDVFTRRVDPVDAERELLRTAARAHGIGTASDLADYFRMTMAAARPRIAELVESGDLREVRVEGWRETAYRHRDAGPPRGVDVCALLSPFDPVVWFRKRTLRVFDFDYRFEIFIPDARRKWGSYVLPFLYGDALVARVDVKADRKDRLLRVAAAFLEPAADAAAVASALVGELHTLAAWLGLNGVQVGRRGNFATALRAQAAELDAPGRQAMKR
jgi:uncharacterized protein